MLNARLLFFCMFCFLHNYLSSFHLFGTRECKERGIFLWKAGEMTWCCLLENVFNPKSVVRAAWSLLAEVLKTIETIGTIRFSFLCLLASERPRRGRISITAGWAAEGCEACGPHDEGKIVLEEGEHMGYVYGSLVFALFEDVLSA